MKEHDVTWGMMGTLCTGVSGQVVGKIPSLRALAKRGFIQQAANARSERYGWTLTIKGAGLVRKWNFGTRAGYGLPPQGGDAPQS